MKKKSQEETIGFVLIIVLVAVIALVFLAINLRKAPVKLPSNEVEGLLQSAMRYSSECYASEEIREDIKDLITSCSDNGLCLSGESSCSVLNRTLSGILKESLNPGAESQVKSYNLKIENTGLNNTVLSLIQGNCTGTFTTADLNIPSDSGNINVELEICT